VFDTGTIRHGGQLQVAASATADGGLLAAGTVFRADLLTSLSARQVISHQRWWPNYSIAPAVRLCDADDGGGGGGGGGDGIVHAAAAALRAPVPSLAAAAATSRAAAAIATATGCQAERLLAAFAALSLSVTAVDGAASEQGPIEADGDETADTYFDALAAILQRQE